MSNETILCKRCGTPLVLPKKFKELLSKTEISPTLNPVRNSSGALDPAGIILKCNPAAEQRGINSNGVKKFLTNTKLKGINKLIHIYINKEGGRKIMSCGMKHPKPKKTIKKATPKKKK
jgi:hypothetical protein